MDMKGKEATFILEVDPWVLLKLEGLMGFLFVLKDIRYQGSRVLMQGDASAPFRFS